MKSYGCSVRFHSPPVAVYAALTTAQGLRGWWTTQCVVGREVGDVCRFRIDDGHGCTVKIIRLAPNEKVEWRCIEHRLDAPDEVGRSDEWIGTTLKFHLTGLPDGGTELWFQHAGLTEDLDCFEICNDAWELALCASLKEYVDTGVGRPYSPAEPADQASAAD